jgi:large subunit ribosomal protein L37Ae
MKPSGSFGPRYGKRVKERFFSTLKEKDYECPNCKGKTVKRVSKGVWSCRKCGLKFAGKAYKPS